MLDWLIDNATIVYVILGLVAVALLFALWTKRKRAYAIGLGVAVALIALVLLLTRIPTDRSQIVGAIQEMSEGVRTQNVDRIFAHISDQFRIGSMSKASFRPLVEQELRSGGVTEVVAYDFEALQGSRQDRRAAIEFKVKPKGGKVGDGTFYFCKATFVLDPDGKWRMSAFNVRDPLTNQPLSIPGIQ